MRRNREIIKWVSEKQAIRLFEKRGVKINVKNLKKVGNGAVVLMIRNDEKGTDTYYKMQRIFIEEFKLKYSVHKNTKSGSELFISSFPLTASQKKLLKKI